MALQSLLSCTKENSKYTELRRKIIDSFNKPLSNLEKDLIDFTSKLDCYSGEINDFFAKMFQAKKLVSSVQDSILGLLSLKPQEAIEKVKSMTIGNRQWYNGAKLFYVFNEKLESLNRFSFTEKFSTNNMQNTPETHNKTSLTTSTESSSAGNLISWIMNKDNSLKLPKNGKELIKNKLKSEISLLNSQISTATNNLNIKTNETESALNVIDILRNKSVEILGRPNNPELEKDFRTACSAFQIYSSPLMQPYQNYLNAYQQKASLYNFIRDSKGTHLIIYNTETKTQEVKTLQTPELDFFTCITQLPNGKLFCFGNYQYSGITVLIDANGRVEVLSSGTPCRSSSCIYFSNSVYCFGEIILVVA